MSKQQNYLAIIPARGGSKRLPRKNILPLAGKPLIAWTIDASKHCPLIDTTVVSSDDPEILALAAKAGVDTLTRPAALASDVASSVDVVRHVLEQYQNRFEYLVLLQPTSPLRNHQHISEAIQTLEAKQADAVISVCAMEHSPLWSNTLPENGSMAEFLRDEVKHKRSQDLPTYYRINGAIYICRTDKFLAQNSLFLNANIYSYIMPNSSSIDIDTAIDFELADFVMQKQSILQQ